MKLSIRLNILFTVIVTGILLGMALIVYNLSRNNVQQDFRQRLKTRAARTAYFFGLFSNDTTNLLKSIDASTPPALFNKKIIIYDTRFTELYEYHDSTASVLKADTNWLHEAMEDGDAYHNRKGNEIYIMYDSTIRNGIIVLVGSENLAGAAYISNLKRTFLLYGPLAVFVALLAGYIFSRSIVKPIRETIHDVQLITSQNLSQRLYTGKRKDELAELNSTFNELLNRLEESFAIEKRFISNASHEFSTPLTAISSQIQVALIKERDVHTYQSILRSVQKDVEGLHQLTRNLLEIARAGTHGAISLEKMRLDEVIIKAHSDLLRQHPLFKTTLDFSNLPENENECLVFGNPALLYSAFRNVMENGCKYSPDHTTHVRLQFRGNEADITFTNKSDMLTAEEIERLFEPFYRSANAGDKRGVGLGLTLTRRIIGLHKGTIRVQSDEDTGTIILVTLPTLLKD